MSEKCIAALDIDGTFYRPSLFISLVDKLRERGILQPELFSAADQLKKLWKARKGTYNHYLNELVRLADSGVLKGAHESAIDETSDAVLEESGEDVYVFTRELFYALKETGYVTVAISHSPSIVVKRFAERWGFDDWSGTSYEIGSDGRYTGTRTKGNKTDVFREMCAKHGCSANGSIAIGDSVSDLDLLGQVAHPIVFNPERDLEGQARRFQTPVVKERKDTIEAWRGRAGMGKFEEMTLDEFLPKTVATNLNRRLTDLGHDEMI